MFNSTREKLNRIIANHEIIMSALDDLKSALADLSTQLAANNAEIDLLLTKITATGTSDADVEAAVASIRDLTAANKAETDKLAALNSPTPPAPAPAA